MDGRGESCNFLQKLNCKNRFLHKVFLLKKIAIANGSSRQF